MTDYLNRDTVDRADRSQPAVRQRAAQQRPRSVVLADGRWSRPRTSRCPSARNTRAQFRLEAFNLLNRVNFRAPEREPQRRRTTARSRSTYDARQLQLGVKVTF